MIKGFLIFRKVRISRFSRFLFPIPIMLVLFTPFLFASRFNAHEEPLIQEAEAKHFETACRIVFPILYAAALLFFAFHFSLI